MRTRRQRDQEGQVLILAVFVMAFLFVPLSIYVIDSGLVEAAHVQTGEALQAAAEDGAQSIDVDAFRESGGQVVRLDPDQARVAADRSMRASRLPGLESWTVVVNGNTVTVTARVRVGLLILGAVTLTQRKGATFAVGT